MAWMKPKPEETTRPQAPSPAAPTPSAPAPAVPGSGPFPEPHRAEKFMADKLVHIGQSVQIKGELTGNEDLTIEGKVDGKIVLRDHNLTIGANGRITAEIHAKTVLVVGEVIGNIVADDKVEIAATGSMKGDIISPRLVLADGAKFKGAVDMERKGAPAGAPRPPEPVRTPEPVKVP